MSAGSLRSVSKRMPSSTRAILCGSSKGESSFRGTKSGTPTTTTRSSKTSSSNPATMDAAKAADL
eukprot:118158-Alexandrium_andersonii.AAC.1